MCSVFGAATRARSSDEHRRYDRPNRGKTVPPIEQNDVIVRQNKEARPVTGLTSLKDADTDFLLLIDDSSRSTFNTEIQTLKSFLTSLPANYSVAVAYMRNGMAQLTQSFTRDHAAAAASIRVVNGPGGADVSPYDSLTDAIKKWPEDKAQRRQVFMISSGVEALGGGFSSDNPYVNAGISSAQKAGVTVYSIYSPSVGHSGHSFWRSSWGQNFLSQMADATGGESYYIGFGSPVSFQPFLDEYLAAQKNQYLLTFVAQPVSKSGLQPIRVLLEHKDASISAPNKVFVRASL